MALPYLVKHIYNNGSEEVIRRGKKIHALGNVELMEYDELMSSVNFRVKDDSYSTYYKVYITQFKEPTTLKLRCTCPYNLSEICRHKAGALFTLQEMLDKNMLGERELVYDQKHTIVKMKMLDLKMIRMLSSPESFITAENFLQDKKAKIANAKDERVTAVVDMGGAIYNLVLLKNEERNFDTSCTCNSDTKHPLCVHKAIVFLQLLKAKGANYFDTIRNWDAVKNKLLSIYGYSLEDNLKGKFEFTYTEGKPFLRVLDSSIKRVITVINSVDVKPQVVEVIAKPLTKIEATNEAFEATVIKEQVLDKAPFKLGIVITTNEQQYPYLQVEAIQGETDDDFSKYTGKLKS